MIQEIFHPDRLVSQIRLLSRPAGPAAKNVRFVFPSQPPVLSVIKDRSFFVSGNGFNSCIVPCSLQPDPEAVPGQFFQAFLCFFCGYVTQGKKLLSIQPIQLPDRADAQPVVSKEKFQRQPAVMGPAGGKFLFRVPLSLGNGKQNGPAVRRHKPAGTRKNAVAQIDEPCFFLQFFKSPAGRIPVSEKIPGFHHIPFYLTGAQKKDVAGNFPRLLPKGQQHREFPYMAQGTVFFVIVLQEKFAEVPVFAVVGNVQGRVSAAVIFIPGSHQHEIFPVFHPDKRIPKLPQPAFLLPHFASLLFPGNQFGICFRVRHRHGHGLIGKFPVVSGGIKNPGLSVCIHQGASRPAAIRIDPVLVGFQRQWQILPVHHVPADQMSPLKMVPDGRMGICLIKNMIVSPAGKRAVGLVHPFSRRNEVVAGPLHVLFVSAPVRTGNVRRFLWQGLLQTPDFFCRQFPFLQTGFLQISVKRPCFGDFRIFVPIHIFSQKRHSFRKCRTHVPQKLFPVGKDPVDIQIAPAGILTEYYDNPVPLPYSDVGVDGIKAKEGFSVSKPDPHPSSF